MRNDFGCLYNEDVSTFDPGGYPRMSVSFVNQPIKRLQLPVHMLIVWARGDRLPVKLTLLEIKKDIVFPIKFVSIQNI